MAQSMPVPIGGPEAKTGLFTKNAGIADKTTEDAIDVDAISPRSHLFRIIFSLILIAAPTAALPWINPQLSRTIDHTQWIQIHTVLGSGIIAVTVTVFLLGGSAFLRCGTRDFLILSLGLLAAAIFDVAHVLGVANLWPQAAGSIADWMALLATLCVAATLTAAVFWKGRVKAQLSCRFWLTAAALLITAALYGAIFLTPLGQTAISLNLDFMSLGGLLTLLCLVALTAGAVRAIRASFTIDNRPLSDMAAACGSMAMMVLDEAADPSHGTGSQLIAHVSLLIATLFVTRYVFLQGIKVPFERQRTNESLRIFKHMVESASNGIILCDATKPHTPIVYVNQAFQNLTGYSLADVQGRDPRFLQSTGELPHDTAANGAPLNGSIILQTTLRDQNKNGQSIWIELTVSALKDDQGKTTHYVGIQNDITARKLVEQELEHQAFSDELTALPNRRLFVDRVERALAVTASNKLFGAIIMVDMDHFRRLNEGRSYSSGDALLRQVAQRFSAMIRSEDTLARLGGDEFGVVLPMLGKDAQSAAQAARNVADRMKKQLTHPFSIGDLEHYITASFGMTIFPNAGKTAEDLLKQADTAVFRVKENGRNGCGYYEESMQKTVEAQLSLQGELRHAVQRGEMRIFIQPQVDADGVWSGGEALLRWQSSKHGMVSPLDFIPIAEDTGLIIPIGEYVLRETCRLSRWLSDSGHPMQLAVNVSPIQFRAPRFVHRLRAILRLTRVDPRSLILELTEGTVLENVDESIKTMSELGRLGLHISIDDFGTGYSSLSYLKKLPIHELKIDRSFIKDAPNNANDAALIEAILAVARHHNLHVVAEGVETTDQLEFLKVRGCASFQGFYFAKPMPMDQFSQAICTITGMPSPWPATPPVGRLRTANRASPLGQGI